MMRWNLRLTELASKCFSISVYFRHMLILITHLEEVQRKRRLPLLGVRPVTRVEVLCRMAHKILVLTFSIKCTCR